MYRLEQSHPDFFGVAELRFEKTGEKFKAVLEEENEDTDGIQESVHRTVVMDDLKVLVTLGTAEKEMESGEELDA